jgi:hypothetical protein
MNQATNQTARNTVEVTRPVRIEGHLFKRMVFIANAVEKGWTVTKKTDTYVFTKKHEGRKEVLLDSYLDSFIATNSDLSALI